MGLLRFLLAVSVIIAHSQPYHGLTFVGGPMAVEAFFIISGFYITMILNEKYLAGKGSYWLFISNRFLRLYPFYWVVMVVTVIIALVAPNYNNTSVMNHLANYEAYGDKLSLTTWVFLIFSHITIFLQDVTLFMGLNLETGNLYLTHSFHNTGVKVFQLMMVGQAWSISLELMFYLVAPFIVRNKKLVVSLMLASFALKYYGHYHGYGDDPWSYRFFPFELGYFLLGSIAYFLYKRYVIHLKLPKSVYIADLILVVIATTFLKKMNLPYGDQLYLTLIFLSIPLLFNFTKRMKYDRLIGELSYPIYLTHLVVINTVVSTRTGFHPDLIVIASTLIFSYILIKFFGEPLERYRQHRMLLRR
jgi:peptidoglycan/LPS O-acetylase OafA/YrhL